MLLLVNKDEPRSPNRVNKVQFTSVFHEIVFHFVHFTPPKHENNSSLKKLICHIIMLRLLAFPHTLFHIRISDKTASQVIIYRRCFFSHVNLTYLNTFRFNYELQNELNNNSAIKFERRVGAVAFKMSREAVSLFPPHFVLRKKKRTGDRQHCMFCNFDIFDSMHAAFDAQIFVWERLTLTLHF